MEGTSLVALVVRVVISLAVVLAVMAGAAAVLRRNGVGGMGGARRTGRVEVMARHGLSRASSVAVVRLGERALVLGVTEHSVTLLAEADPAELAPQEPEAPGTASPGGFPPASSAWKAILEQLRDRTVRRS
jgi:flagellar protein FliO/FliZ